MKDNRNVEIDAILGSEFDELLRDLEVYEDFVAGKYNCHICGDIVNENNVTVIFPISQNEVGFICSKAVCLNRYQDSSKKRT
ncbi:MAG: hypothetical protein JW762_10410 [Dehalococcoidales bacterium]|nr:hypothetical protein [Dehalococcoidales bacterium]